MPENSKNRIASSLSAIVLLAFAIIWLVYLCGQELLSERAIGNLSFTVSVLAMLAYVVKAIFSKDSLPKWVVVILFVGMAGTVPATILDFLQTCGFDVLAVAPVLKDILYISHKCAFIVLYVLLMISACGLTDSLIFKLIFITIGCFLIFCVVAEWIPFLAANFPLPLIGFNA